MSSSHIRNQSESQSTPQPGPDTDRGNSPTPSEGHGHYGRPVRHTSGARAPKDRDLLETSEVLPVSLRYILERGRPLVFDWELPAVVKSQGTSEFDNEVLLLASYFERNSEEMLEHVQAKTFAECLAEYLDPPSQSFIRALIDEVSRASDQETGKLTYRPRFRIFSRGTVCSIAEESSLVRGSYSHVLKENASTLASISYSDGEVELQFGHIDDLAQVVPEVIGIIKALELLCSLILLPADNNMINLISQKFAIVTSSPVNQKVHMEINRTTRTPHTNRCCWKPLFTSCNITCTRYFQLHDFGTGLEISFDLLMSLAAIEFSVVIDEGIVFVGYQTAIIPTKMGENWVQFHLYTNDNGQINPYQIQFEHRLRTGHGTQSFRTMRCFLGWCEVAQINLGTTDLPTGVGYSTGRSIPRSIELDGFSPLAQVGGGGIATATVGLQVNYKFTSHTVQFSVVRDYASLITNTARQLAILYDSWEKRCWLVPKLSLLVHMSRVYISQDGLRAGGPIPAIDGHQDSEDILQVVADLGEKIISSAGGEDFTFRQLMKYLNLNLVAARYATKNSGGGSLHGFEFMEIISPHGTASNMKQLNLNHADTWLSIVNGVDSIIVGSKMGNVITPRGPGRPNAICNVLPPDHDYLAATVPCLRRLVSRTGGDLLDRATSDGRIKISQGCYWSITGQPFSPCEHTNHNTCWMRDDLFQSTSDSILSQFQALVFRKQTPAQAIPPSGAVVFGRPNR